MDLDKGHKMLFSSAHSPSTIHTSLIHLEPALWKPSTMLFRYKTIKNNYTELSDPVKPLAFILL